MSRTDSGVHALHQVVFFTLEYDQQQEELDNDLVMTPNRHDHESTSTSTSTRSSSTTSHIEAISTMAPLDRLDGDARDERDRLVALELMRSVELEGIGLVLVRQVRFVAPFALHEFRSLSESKRYTYLVHQGAWNRELVARTWHTGRCWSIPLLVQCLKYDDHTSHYQAVADTTHSLSLSRDCG